MYSKDSYEAKYQLLINKRESIGLNHFNNSKTFNEYSNDMDDIYKSTEEFHPNIKHRILIVFDTMISDIPTIKKLNSLLTEINLILLFLLHNSILLYQKNIRLNSTNYFVLKIPNKRELQQIEFQGFMNL